MPVGRIIYDTGVPKGDRQERVGDEGIVDTVKTVTKQR
jgi:hypothetical protein